MPHQDHQLADRQTKVAKPAQGGNKKGRGHCMEVWSLHGCAVRTWVCGQDMGVWSGHGCVHVHLVFKVSQLKPSEQHVLFYAR